MEFIGMLDDVIVFHVRSALFKLPGLTIILLVAAGMIHGQVIDPAGCVSGLAPFTSIVGSGACRRAPPPPWSELAPNMLAMLADPSLHAFIGLAGNAWDFTAPDGVLGFAAPPDPNAAR
jgi:hypothetical protein